MYYSVHFTSVPAVVYIPAVGYVTMTLCASPVYQYKCVSFILYFSNIVIVTGRPSPRRQTKNQHELQLKEAKDSVKYTQRECYMRRRNHSVSEKLQVEKRTRGTDTTNN